MVIAGAPEKPSRASWTAAAPVIAPHPDPSLIIVGWSMQRIIWLRGPLYSAIPSASRVAAQSSPQMRAPMAATPSDTQAPDVWYSAAVACSAMPARIATS